MGRAGPLLPAGASTVPYCTRSRYRVAQSRQSRSAKRQLGFSRRTIPVPRIRQEVSTSTVQYFAGGGKPPPGPPPRQERYDMRTQALKDQGVLCVHVGSRLCRQHQLYTKLCRERFGGILRVLSRPNYWRIRITCRKATKTANTSFRTHSTSARNSQDS